jgi:protein-S-isoprenylcysteine O-methyltransferase Ste14
VVGLTSEQRRQLDELAGELARDNPRLARALAGRWYAVRQRRRTPRPHHGRRSRGLAWLAVIVLLAAVPLLTLGMFLPQPVLIVLGAGAMLNGPILIIAAWSRRPPAG